MYWLLLHIFILFTTGHTSLSGVIPLPDGSFLHKLPLMRSCDDPDGMLVHSFLSSEQNYNRRRFKAFADIQNHPAVSIVASFWRTTWVRDILIFMFGALSFLFLRLRLNQARSEMEFEKKLEHVRTQAEINALRSQMNPHFIFNCMNTIDSYIVLSKTSEASEFLQKFSRLVRMILEYSRQEYISIEEDLQALELYIQLEQERSNNAFSYEIFVDHAFYEQEFLIPSMLFQPFVENAILHGLRHKKTDNGELFINIKKKDGSLICTIIDNGIGRVAAARINFFRKHQSKPVGLKLTEERIRNIGVLYPKLAYLKITDIDTEDDTGTIVEIGLPLLTLEKLKS